MESSLIPVDPVAPVAAYLGGKRNLAATIIERLRHIPHDTYVEPFCGLGGVFLRRPFRPRGSEVINDISRDVATLFRVLQRHYPLFLQMIQWTLTSRAEFERLAAENPDGLTDLERSARFLYLQRTAYGGKVHRRNFGVSVGRPARFDVTRLAPMLADVHHRLSGVVIECLPWDKLLPLYDRPGTLFYLDPPYWGCETDYGPAVFAREDFERLATALRVLRGRFVLSLNDVPEVRAVFSAFDIEAVETSYSISSGAPKRVGEVLISNPR